MEQPDGGFQRLQKSTKRLVNGPHNRRFRKLASSIGAAAAALLLAWIDYRLAHVNSATAAFTFLLLVLSLATRVSLRESIIASVVSMLAYNYFFLPPIGTLTISDPQNWVALLTFLATAITTSHLSSSARRKAEEAASRGEELRGVDVRFTPKEFEMLLYLATHPDVPIPHGRLLQAIWGPDYGNEVEYLHVFANQIRKKIEPNTAHPRHLLTEPRVGYRFSLEDKKE